MTVKLLPFDESAFPGWLEEQAQGYIVDRMRAGDDRAVAEAKATSTNEKYFPGGRPIAGHTVYRVTSEGRDVGVLWLGPHPDALEGVAWVWSIEITEAERGRGLGRATMAEAERAALAEGYTDLALNVFGFNTAARSLYESMGYQTTSLQMRKAL
ncbi:MAG: GNAT family N-acetyltransferase [Glaciihabitans sp.]